MGRPAQVWPSELEESRRAAVETVDTARRLVMIAHAAQTASNTRNAAKCLSTACRDCQRMLIAAQQYRHPAGRWSSRLKALRGLINDQAIGGVDLADALLSADPTTRGALLVDAIALLADLQFYLETLASEYVGGF